MTLKRLQWLLFLLIAFGTPCAVFGAGLTNARAIVVLFGGFSASLFVFCFVPYLPKYYLSELLFIIGSLAAVMTLMANALFLEPYAEGQFNETWFIVSPIASLLVPLATYFFLEMRRPENERIGAKLLKPTEPTPEERMRNARNSMFLYGAASIIWPALHYLTGSRLLSPATFFAALTLVSFFGNWRAYCNAKLDAQKTADKSEST